MVMVVSGRVILLKTLARMKLKVLHRAQGSGQGPVDGLRLRGLLRPPNVALLRALWSLLDGIWGVLQGSWGVLVSRYLLSFVDVY